ncbi:MAG: DUF4838 domain-containing protein [bacterium]
MTEQSAARPGNPGAIASNDYGTLSWAWRSADTIWWRQGESALPIRVWGELSTDHLAARELREHLDGLTGITWPAAVPMRPNDTSAPGIVLALASDQPPVTSPPNDPESYRLVCRDDSVLWIVGADERGLLYGVYDLLEGWGVRWFQPGAVGTHLPRVDRLPLPHGLSRTGQPDFVDRGYHITGYGRTRDGEPAAHYDHQTLLWMLRNRMNFKPIHNYQAEDVLPRLQSLHLQALPFGHSYSRWIPADEFERHPEWFALVGGERTAGGQLCLSNAELREALVNRIVAFIDHHPSLPFVSLAPNDGYRFCQCEDCLAMDTKADREAGELNRRHHAFTAAIADEVARRRPGAKVSTIAYSNYLDPADDVPPEPAMLVSCTVAGASLAQAIDDPSSPANATIWRRIQRWAAKSGGVYFSAYYLSYGGRYPRPYHHVTVQTYRALHKAGVRGVKSEVSPGYKPRWRSAVLHMYLATRYLWDVDQDLDPFLEDFYHLYYGPAAGDARRVHETFQRAVARYDGEISAMDARLLPDLFTDTDVKRITQAAGRAASHAEDVGWPYTERIGALVEQCQLVDASYREVTDALNEPTEVTIPAVSESEKGIMLALRQRDTLLPLEPRARVWLRRDDEALHIDVSVEETLEPSASGDDAGKVWGQSHVDLFLCPDPGSEVYYQIAVDWQGDVYTARCRGREWNASYPLELEKQVRVEADGWHVQLRVPYTALQAAQPTVDARWRGGFNVGLKGKDQSARYGGWPRGGAFHDIGRFGELRFE